MDLSNIKKIIKLVENANISALSLEEKGFKIEVKKELSGQVVTTIPQQPIPHPPTPEPKAKEEPTPKSDPNLTPIKSPMVGTYYASPNPESPPYVKVGDKINKGDTICVIEAMKIFNEIESDVSGIVEQICVDNSAAVEYGQELIYIRT